MSIRYQNQIIANSFGVIEVTQAEFDAIPIEERKGKFYCITDSNTRLKYPGEKFSTEETCIGTWIDGKPLYRKVYIGTSGPINVLKYIIDADDVDFFIGRGQIHRTGKITEAFPNLFVQLLIQTLSDGSRKIGIFIRNAEYENAKIVCIFYYTKFSDEAVTE